MAAKRGKGFAQDGTAKQGSASSVDGSASQGSALGVDGTADFVVLGAKGGDGGEPGTKKLRGNEYECAECAISYPHKEMIKSVRSKHTVTIKPEAAPGDAAVQDALGQKRFQDLQWDELKKACRKICKDCELMLRLEEWRAAGDAALDRYGADYATMRQIEAGIYRAHKGESHSRRGEAYQQAIKMLGDDEDFKYLTRAEQARRKTQKCKEITMAVIKVLQSDQSVLQIFQEAGRRIRAVSDIWAKVEELDAAAAEAKKAGQHAQASPSRRRSSCRSSKRATSTRP